MRAVFADSGYWVAIANSKDNLHTRAVAAAERLGECRIVTSEMVLVEFLNGFAECGSHLRTKAAELVLAVTADPDIEVVPQTPELFQDALALYQDRVDKSWSLTDCASFLIMDRRQIREALTHDRHFEQRGYRALLRD
jgi:predicted nucleic acid-binding protein